MSTYRRYQEARDAAWRTLARLEIRSLPVEPDEVLQKLGLTALPFPETGEAPRLHTLLSRAAGQGRCVSLRIGGQWRVFYRAGAMDERETRFALAHEAGHVILRHDTYALAPGVRAFQSGENPGDLLDAPETMADYAADIFALRLLAPACVLHELGVDTPGGVAALCGLPPRAAQMRAERMELLGQRNAFYTHPLEKRALAQFSAFIAARVQGPAERPAAPPPRAFAALLPPVPPVSRPAARRPGPWERLGGIARRVWDALRHWMKKKGKWLSNRRSVAAKR